MMSGMDQRELIPLLFRESAEKGMRKWLGRHGLKCRDFATELVDGGGLVMRGSGKPPLGHLDSRFHASLAQDTLQDQRTEDFADDPCGPMIVTSLGCSQTFSNVVHDLREIPIPGAVITGTIEVVDVRQGVRPVPEV